MAGCNSQIITAMEDMFVLRNVPLKELHINDGQIADVPRNPRFIRDDKFEDLKRSIENSPEMLALRELIVYDNGGELVIIGGNMRYRAMRELGYKEAPCKILNKTTPADKLREYIIKDNLPYGQNDWDIIANEWDSAELADWGMDIPDFEDVEDLPTESEPELTPEQLSELIEKASLGCITEYNEDTNYDLAKLFRRHGNAELEKMLAEGQAQGAVRKEIAEVCKMRLAQCTTMNFDEIIKYYRSDDCSDVEKELLKKLYLVFVTPKETVESAMLRMEAATGRIFEQEFSANEE